MKRKLTILTLVLFFSIFFLTVAEPFALAQDLTVFDKLEEGLFVEDTKRETVYLGGYPVGLTIDGVGVLVVGLNEFIADNGKVCCPSLEFSQNLTNCQFE